MEDLDRLLMADESVTPSPGFAAVIMDAVEVAAAEPPPLPFPWRPFAAGLLGCAVWAASCVWLLQLVSASTVGVIQQVSAVRTPLEYAAATAVGCLAVLTIQRTRRRIEGW